MAVISFLVTSLIAAFRVKQGCLSTLWDAWIFLFFKSNNYACQNSKYRSNVSGLSCDKCGSVYIYTGTALTAFSIHFPVFVIYTNIIAHSSRSRPVVPLKSLKHDIVRCDGCSVLRKTCASGAYTRLIKKKFLEIKQRPFRLKVHTPSKNTVKTRVTWEHVWIIREKLLFPFVPPYAFLVYFFAFPPGKH